MGELVVTFVILDISQLIVYPGTVDVKVTIDDNSLLQMVWFTGLAMTVPVGLMTNSRKIESTPHELAAYNQN